MPTRIPRTLLPDFALDNPTYAGATLAVYEVDSSLARTATLATLYADETSGTLLANPQTLNSDGQNAAPIYIDRPVAPVVTRDGTPEYLGVQGVTGRWRGIWATGTLYFVSERIRDPGGPSTYLATTSHTSSGSFATDLAALKWEEEIDAEAMAEAAGDAILPSAPGRNGKLLGFNATTGDPEAVVRDTVLLATGPTGGTSTALTATLAETIVGYSEGLTIVAEIGTTCGDAPQLNAGGIGLRKIYMSTVFGPVQAVPGDLLAGNRALFCYDSTQDGGTGGWVVPPGARPLPTAGESLGLLLNPRQEVSQENGTTAVTLGASAVNVIDKIGGAENCATLTATAQQVADPFSSFSGFRRLRYGHRATVGTLQASLAAGEYLRPWRQDLPGTFWRGLGWGTADARAVDLVAIVMASVAGTYAVALRNGAAARSYVSTVTLAANTPTVILLKGIPGDTSGTWATDGGTGLTLDIGAVTGTTYQAGSLNAWAAGNFLSHSTATNYGGTSGATFTVGYAEIFPVGVLPFMTAAQITGEPLQCLLNLRRPFETERARCQKRPGLEEIDCVSLVGQTSAAIVIPDGFRKLVVNVSPSLNIAAANQPIHLQMMLNSTWVTGVATRYADQRIQFENSGGLVGTTMTDRTTGLLLGSANTNYMEAEVTIHLPENGSGARRAQGFMRSLSYNVPTTTWLSYVNNLILDIPASQRIEALRIINLAGAPDAWTEGNFHIEGLRR